MQNLLQDAIIKIGTLVTFLCLPMAVADETAQEADSVGVNSAASGTVKPEYTSAPTLSIQPRATLRTVYGDTDLEDSGLMSGGHDPSQNGFSIPDLSLGLDLTYGEHLAAFTEGILTWNKQDGWSSEIEEAYVKVLQLPGELEIHAGILLTKTGTRNHTHTHSWKFVDAPLGNVRFLGEEGLAIEGVEILWSPPTRWDDRFTISFGHAVEHDHAHEEEHEDHAGHLEHEHSEEAEELLWDRDVFSARYEATFWPTDQKRHTYGISYVQGTNFMGHRSQLYGMDFTYYYCEDEIHASQFTWRSEAMLRKVDTDDGSFSEFTISSAALYSFNPQWEIGLRYDYLEGVANYDLPERHRISPSITRYFNWDDNVHSSLRLQYNFDHSDKRGEDHSIWLQFMIEWGNGDAHVH